MKVCTEDLYELVMKYLDVSCFSKFAPIASELTYSYGADPPKKKFCIAFYDLLCVLVDNITKNKKIKIVLKRKI